MRLPEARLKHFDSACEFENQIEAVVLVKFVIPLDSKLFGRVSEEDHQTITLTRALELSSKMGDPVAGEIDWRYSFRIVSGKGVKWQF